MKNPLMKNWPFSGKVSVYGKTVKFHVLRELTIYAFRTIWVYDGRTQKHLKFKPAPAGAYKGMAHFLKRWRERKDIFRPKSDRYGALSQTEAAKELGVSQSLLSKVERGRRKLPMRVSERIRKDMEQLRHDSEILG